LEMASIPLKKSKYLFVPNVSVYLFNRGQVSLFSPDFRIIINVVNE